MLNQFLGFLQVQVRALKKAEPERHTITMILVGIPNVGKSALANSLHQIGRISAAGIDLSIYSSHVYIPWSSGS